MIAAEDALRSFRLLRSSPHSQEVSSSSNGSLPSSVTPRLSSPGRGAKEPYERGLGRGDRSVKRCARVVGDGGAFGSRRREWILELRVGVISSREMWCATGTTSNLCSLLCRGDGTVESAVPAITATWLEWMAQLWRRHRDRTLHCSISSPIRIFAHVHLALV